MKVGKAVRGAVKTGKSPVDEMLNALDPRGFKLFEGEVFDYWQDGEFSFIWGTAKAAPMGWLPPQE